MWIVFPFSRLTFPSKTQKRKRGEEPDVTDAPEEQVLWVEPHVIANRGPYVYSQPKRYVAPAVCGALWGVCELH